MPRIPIESNSCFRIAVSCIACAWDMAMETQYGGLDQRDRMNMVTWMHRMLPSVDTDLQQLSVPATVSRFNPLTSLDYHVHSALAADIHSLALRAIFSQAVCSKAWKFLCWVGSYDKLDCCWKIRNPNHQQKIMKENQVYGSYCKCIEISQRGCSMRHAALSQLGIFELKIQQGKYRWSILVTIMLQQPTWEILLHLFSNLGGCNHELV